MNDVVDLLIPISCFSLEGDEVASLWIISSIAYIISWHGGGGFVDTWQFYLYKKWSHKHINYVCEFPSSNYFFNLI